MVDTNLHNGWTERVKKCDKCDLCRSKKVLGELLSSNQSIMLVGGSPGEQEENEGKLFIGKTGKLIMEVLSQVGLKREDVYLTNIVKCCPLGNKTIEEASLICKEWLYEEIRIVKPQIIVPIGGFAITAFGFTDNISNVRGNWFNWEGIDIMPILEPSHDLYEGGGEVADVVVSDLIKVRAKLWGVGLRGKIKSIKIKSNLLGKEVIIGEGGISLSEIWGMI